MMRIIELMKYLAAILMIGAVLICRAEDFTWSFLGGPGKNSKNVETALFDRQLTFKDPSVIWEAAEATKGCGVLIEFAKPVALSRVVVISSKPNALSWGPEKTEFTLWDETGAKWLEPITVNDVTGKISDKNFTSAAVRTEWKMDGRASKYVRILAYGGGIWMTEVEVYARNEDGMERLLKAQAPSTALPQAEMLKTASFGSGAKANIGMWQVKNGWIGNPNALNRNDRVIFHFDLSAYLLAGSVKQAVLSLPLEPFGVLDGNEVELEYFTKEHAPIMAIDLVAQDTEPVAVRMIDRRTYQKHRFDITAMVNKALEHGQGTIAFRLRNITTEAKGNRQNNAEGVAVNPGLIELEIMK